MIAYIRYLYFVLAIIFLVLDFFAGEKEGEHKAFANENLYLGGGGTLLGGKIIVNVPEGTAVVKLEIGCPGGIGSAGWNFSTVTSGSNQEFNTAPLLPSPNENFHIPAELPHHPE